MISVKPNFTLQEGSTRDDELPEVSQEAELLRNVVLR